MPWFQLNATDDAFSLHFNSRPRGGQYGRNDATAFLTGKRQHASIRKPTKVGARQMVDCGKRDRTGVVFCPRW